MTISAKYASICPKCLVRIAIGEPINWTRGTKAEHIVCPAPPVHAVNVTPASAPVPTAVIGGIANIVALLSKVSVANGGTLKAPKMRFLAPDGNSELRLSLATRPKNPKNAGGVYVHITGRYVGTIRADGTTFINDAALVTTLTNIGNDPAAAAKAYGAFAGRCSFCGLELTDAGSVEVGYGPICAANYGLPHKSKGTPTVTTVGTVAPAPVPTDAELETAVEAGYAAAVNAGDIKAGEPFVVKPIADVLSQFPKGTSARDAIDARKAPRQVEIVNGIRIINVDE